MAKRLEIKELTDIMGQPIMIPDPDNRKTPTMVPLTLPRIAKVLFLNVTGATMDDSVKAGLFVRDLEKSPAGYLELQPGVYTWLVDFFKTHLPKLLNVACVSKILEALDDFERANEPKEKAQED